MRSPSSAAREGLKEAQDQARSCMIAKYKKDNANCSSYFLKRAWYNLQTTKAMLDTAVVLPLFSTHRHNMKEGKDFISLQEPKRDYGFMIILAVLFLVGTVIGFLVQNAIYNAQHTIPWGAVKYAILPEGWEDLYAQKDEVIPPYDRRLIQHHFFNLARENEKINNGTTDVFYHKQRAKAAIFKEGKWPSKKTFYKNYVSKSIPVVLRGYAKQFEAFKKWTTDEYIISKIGDVQVRVETSSDNRYTGDRSKMQFTLFSFEEFLQHYSQPNRKQNYYLAQTNMANFEGLHGDFPQFPKIFGKHMKHDVTQLWYGAGGQITPMHFDENENILCQIYGARTFTIMDPYFYDMVYIDHVKTQVYSLLDPHKPDLEKYPLFKYTRQVKVKVGAGDCIYLPSYWYHKVESAQGRNVAINWWYMPVSEIANTVWVALSSRIWKEPSEPLELGRKLGKK